MSNLNTTIRTALGQTLAGASRAQIMRVIEALLDDEVQVEVPQVLSTADGRFVRVDDEGSVGDCSDESWVATWDRETDLIWSHCLGNTSSGQPWVESMKIADSYRLFNQAFSAPAVKQLLSIVDYERWDPAVDPQFFRGPYGWHWSKTPRHGSSDGAWIVFFGSGNSNWSGRSDDSRVRAVCSGQSIGLRN